MANSPRNPVVSSGHSSLHSSRLVRIISSFNVTDVEMNKNQFAEKFGQMVDFSGSLTLLALHDELKAIMFAPTDISAESIKEDFLRMRTDLVRFIAMSFVPGSEPTSISMVKLPTSKKLNTHFQETGAYDAVRPWSSMIYSYAYEPYKGFYLSRQKEINTRVMSIRSHIRNSISGVLPDLAKLSALDKAICDVLSPRTQNIFAVIPKLLEKRFRSLLDDNWHKLPDKPNAVDLEQWMKPGGWIAMFCGEMRELLLAELDVRLWPVSGIIESLLRTIHN